MEQETVTSGFEKFLSQRKEPQWLKEYRRKNFEIFLQKPLKKSQYVDIEKLQALLLPAKKKNPLPVLKEKNAQVFSIEEALLEFPQKIRQAIGSESPAKDQFEAFANAFFDSGFVLVSGHEDGGKISPEVKLEDKSVSKNFFFFENEKKAVVFEKLLGNGVFLCNETDFLEENKSAEIVRLHTHASDSTGFFYNQSIVSKDAVLVNANAYLGGRLLRSNTFNNLLGAGAQTKQFDTLLLDNDQLFDLNNTAMHLQPDTKSNTMFKGIVDGKSKSVFDAMIKIVKKAQRSNAFLEAHGMLLSDTASTNNIPGLEIEADDVKATHSASVAHVDEEQVYYLQSRGIPRKQALNLIINGFVESVLLNLDQGIAEEILGQVEKKTQKNE